MRFTQNTPFARKENAVLETVDVIIKTAALVGAVGGIWAAVYAVIKWFQKQEKQSTDIAELRKQHERDYEAMQKKESDDLKALNDELCVLSYAMLAALDGLKQQGCNGEVTKAHDRLEKHLNQKAHDQ